jgi:hypothetical protein
MNSTVKNIALQTIDLEARSIQALSTAILKTQYAPLPNAKAEWW